MSCNGRIYKGDSYEICLPLFDTGVTSVRFYTRGDVIIEKEPVITGDSMCFLLEKEELDVLPDGVLRYEAVTEYDTIDTNTPYVIVTPGDYSGTTLDEMLEEAYHSGYTDGYTSGSTDGYQSGYTDGYEEGQEQCVHDYSKDYLTIEVPEEYYSGDLIIRGTPQYSVNGGEWTMAENPTTIHLSPGDKVRFKGINQGNNLFSSFIFYLKAYGNIMSLIYGDDFIGQTSLIVPKAFENCFRYCPGLFDISNLVLPATTLSEACYRYMFRDTTITTAPALPATTLANNCYEYMFNECTSLTKAPELSATTLANSCYYGMFGGCTSLTTAPELPATTLADECYRDMFTNCRSLTIAPALPATTMAEKCYLYMFAGCASLTTAPELPATTLANACYSNMFQGCTSLTSAPQLPATTLMLACYSRMFQGCTSLITALELPANRLKEGCYREMFSGCASLMYIKCLATTNFSASFAIYEWLQDVSPVGIFVKASGVTWPTGPSGIPSGWTVVDAE